jgi:F0F1-type ATP synthase membrane subunit c/vacuolar-type H+-ATPase subunit K
MVIRDGGWMQTNIITAHVATGSAILGTAIAIALYAHRLLSGTASIGHVSKSRLGVAV